MELAEKIKAAFFEVASETDASLAVEKLEDDTVLLESGLNSLGFAILVVKLEEELGYDPFSMMDEAVYPTTFSEFVEIYKKFA